MYYDLKMPNVDLHAIHYNIDPTIYKIRIQL